MGTYALWGFMHNAYFRNMILLHTHFLGLRILKVCTWQIQICIIVYLNVFSNLSEIPSFQNWIARLKICRWCRPNTRRTRRRLTPRRGWQSAQEHQSSLSYSSSGTSFFSENASFYSENENRTPPRRNFEKTYIFNRFYDGEKMNIKMPTHLNKEYSVWVNR